MDVYRAEDLEILKEKINLIEVVSSYVSLKSTGNVYKGICPFHEEKTPSFIIQKGEAYYHCFGCGAHGDAITFLMNYMQMRFVEAVETLAERFHVPLRGVVKEEQANADFRKKDLKEVLLTAAQFYHYYLLHSEEGGHALAYLYERGLDLNFLSLFTIGFAPKNNQIFVGFMQKHRFSFRLLEAAGLIHTFESRQKKVFFSNRVTLPILDSNGSVIGFSARKISEEVFGPKYINSPETCLFKKARTLYGMSFSRRRIAKERRVIIVEGQIDALRLIQEGFTFTVAGQGTAMNMGQIQELLNLGITQVYLALDGDEAGSIAAYKIGNLFQNEGVEVYVVSMPIDKDPDTILREKGPQFFVELLKNASDYLHFVLKHLSKDHTISSPAQKTRLFHVIAKQIRSWKHPLMVHESLRKLTKLMQIPQHIVDVEQKEEWSSIYVKREGSLFAVDVDPRRILEIDLLRWLFLAGKSMPIVTKLIKAHLESKHFSIEICRRFFSLYIEKLEQQESIDFLTIANNLESAEEQLVFSEIIQKRVNIQRAEKGVVETINKLLEYHWMEEREKIKVQIQSGRCSEEEILCLAKRFDAMKTAIPRVYK